MKANKQDSSETKSPKYGQVSQIDVAQLAGVSQAAVSRTFTPGASVSADVKQQVLDAAGKLGYRPNAIARSLIKNSTRIIGLVMVRFANPFYWQVFDEFTRQLQSNGYWTLLLNTGEEGEDHEIEQTVPTALQYQVDGIIITSATLSSKMADECARAGTPVVLFNRYERETTASAVCCDNIGGGRMVADTLLDAGYQRIAYIAGEEESSTNRDREKGFTEQLRHHGTELAYRDGGGDYTYEAGYTAAKRLLQTDPPPDAIFCASDLIAIGAHDAARELGVNIPEALGLIGFDDISMIAWPRYSISTIRQPVSDMVDKTIEVLLNAIENPNAKPVTHWIPATLVRRDSTRLGRST